MGNYFDDLTLFATEEEPKAFQKLSGPKQTLQQVIEKTNAEIRKAFESQGTLKVGLKQRSRG
jgi:hypothetical protein